MKSYRFLKRTRPGFVSILAVVALVLFIFVVVGLFLAVISSEYRFMNDRNTDWNFVLLSGSHDGPFYMLKEERSLKPGEELDLRHGADRFDCLVAEDGTLYQVHDQPHETGKNMWQNTVRIYYRSQMKEGCTGSGRDLSTFRFIKEKYCSLIEGQPYALCETLQ